MTDTERHRKGCTHYWLYPAGTISGRRNDESAVVRYCARCRTRQVAFFRKWVKATGDYRRNEHYE